MWYLEVGIWFCASCWGGMTCVKALRISLVILAGWALCTAGSEPRVSLDQRGPPAQLLSEGDHCWLGAKVRSLRASPQHHVFGVYPSRPGHYLQPYPRGHEGAPAAGHHKPDAQAKPGSLVAPAWSTEAEQPAGPWGGVRQPQFPKDDASSPDNGGPKESLSNAGAPEDLATTSVHPKDPKIDTRGKFWTHPRYRRQTAKQQASNVRGDLEIFAQQVPLGSQYLRVPRAHASPAPSEATTLDTAAEGGMLWESEPLIPHKGLPFLYFSGRREQLQLRPEALAEVPREAFTVEVWVKPEGGQHNPAIITGVFDNCSHTVNDKGWALGIRTAQDKGSEDARFFFSLRTDRVKKATTVMGHHRYQAGMWTHLAATYDGKRMTLYVDGTQVASSADQSGSLHSPFMASCRFLLLGGDLSEDGHAFRGYLGTLVLWSSALPQSHLQHGSWHPSETAMLSSLILTANFKLQEEQWTPLREGGLPQLELLRGSVPQPQVVSPLQPPRCGQTACDNVDLISQYNMHRPLWGKKVVRYQVVNICDDEGLNPMVSEQQIQRQHQALEEAFGRYNISWQLHELRVRNSTLRWRSVLVHCEPNKVGNDHCDSECNHPITGYDGGDCHLHSRCYTSDLRDGHCQPECNNMLNDFDEGDCCDPTVTSVRVTCFDPDSPRRAYMSVKELKEALRLNSTHFLNIYFASSAREDFMGSATWPWDKEALSHQGGVVLNPTYYGMPGHTNNMIHEMGHILGLYHVFKGVSERESCDDPCQETEPSMETGDLCADTAPTPKSKLCQDPEPINDTCGFTHFPGSPFNNYMSYTDDNCTDNFTPNQVARMHCYLDLVYQEWTESQKPTPIPMPPMVIRQTPESLTIHWLPPISGVVYDRAPDNLCRACSEDGTFHQYVNKASSPRVCDSSGYWTPEEAVGTPDVDHPCEPSLQAWSPELHLYHMNMTVPCPSEGCSLEMLFQHPVQANTLTLWVTYLSTDSSRVLFDTEVLLENQKSVHLGPLDAFCDTPLTIKLNVEGKVLGVKVYTFDERIEIDSALLTSQPRSPLCSACRPVSYQVLREPPFTSGSSMLVNHPHTKFTDMEVTPGQMYRYQVQAKAGAELGEASPALSHIHGGPFCSDGKVDRSLGEECDDGDLLSGDGCSRSCKLEKGFNCAGDPSLCYIYEGDGICEPFEKETSLADCGLYTPQGYLDQWATHAYSSHEDKKKCPVSLVTGEPHSMICKPYPQDLAERHLLMGWFPCGTSGNRAQDEQGEQPEGSLRRDREVWLKVSFNRPEVATAVFIFLTSVGLVPGKHRQPTVDLQLIDVNGNNHSLGTYELSCQHNPLVVNMTLHPNVLFHRTTSVLLKFSSPLVGISAVALRTSSHPLGTSPPAPDSFNPGYQGENHQGQGCAPLLLDHSDIVNCTSDGPGHMKCTITCQRGFALQATSGGHLKPLQKEMLFTCSSGHWDRVMSCMPVNCGIPDPSLVNYATFSCSEGTGFLSRCSIACAPPAKLQGLSPWLTCLEDGLWSLPEAFCKLECDAPPPIHNATLLQPQCLQGSHDVGSICRYQCQPGYYTAGRTESRESKIQSKFLEIQCLESGMWEQGSCSPVVCGRPSPIFEGMYECTNGFEFNSQCVLNCNQESERLSTFCTKEGVWSEEFKCENLQGECPPVPSELNSVEYTCEERYGIGAVCSLTCLTPPSDPVILPENITLDTLQHWMEPVRVQSIVCTGRRQWYPDPFLVQCIKSCEPFQADGWCDTINNRAYCNYDGGDCCSSTLSSKKVTPFAADCDLEECTCRDPKAEENQ
ncbi:pappalysin-2 [Erinaceus europaeus]|uniref:Pappalysin-2 n=1 Tax=Erinaceus europaeus TaxID=9365 RepID=A0ABM3XY10_ERIEU|nr:pappalysin-2 [Erinaceus europaeus]XP_060053707.1 pappalysin-2 [Erinaceus europaeus]XP_060053708.1 pappalysin-2 [Erinaceus europaeus]XP_060053709.1 pappalysin-2 [Erinaceus europaeus]XP_060053710.1 pappalysin-2 [Erinaceus europaeus]XP_060053711.1 pappalysin-2 [Erinaceus europaeus]